MDTLTISGVLAGSIVGLIVAFRLHGQWAGTSGRPGLASMVAFVVGWLCALTAVLTGLFLLTVMRR